MLLKLQRMLTDEINHRDVWTGQLGSDVAGICPRSPFPQHLVNMHEMIEAKPAVHSSLATTGKTFNALRLGGGADADPRAYNL